MAGIFSKIMDFIGLEERSPVASKPMVVSQGPQFYHRKCGVSQNSILITQGTTGAIKIFEFSENLESGDSGFKEHNGCPMCREFVYEHKDTPKPEDVEKKDSEGVTRGNWFSVEEEQDSEGSVASEEEEEWASEDETQWEQSDSEDDAAPESASHAFDQVSKEEFHPFYGPEAVCEIQVGPNGTGCWRPRPIQKAAAPEDHEEARIPNDVVGDFRRFMNQVHEENQRMVVELAGIFE